MTLYVILGAPGAGKGTQAEVLSDRLGLPHVASGDLFRDAMEAGTPLGEEVASYMRTGALVPDDLAIRVVLDRLRRPDAAGGAILDGFPRTRLQAEALDAALAADGSGVTAALYVKVGEPELLRRLSGRWVCRAAGHPYHETSNPPRTPGICDEDGSELYQRADDEPATVRARLEKQLPPMYEVVDYYEDRGVLAAVEGEGTIDQVTVALLRALRSRDAVSSGGPTGRPGAALRR